jgi:DNA ligase D-like protein (predicted 3'-phosphoesterase)
MNRMKKEPLKTYREKRDFKRTPEPSGQARAKGSGVLQFVIQKHDARRLHYDFRLEVGGVLKSWAVPKGPSFDPKDKRLAVRTEDHPMEYANFEGVIPHSEYGGGPVLVWDMGTYRNLSRTDMEKCIEDGRITIWIEGKKIKGGYALTRLRNVRKESWLLIKMDDQEANPNKFPVMTQPESVLTGRSLADLIQEEELEHSA